MNLFFFYRFESGPLIQKLPAQKHFLSHSYVSKMKYFYCVIFHVYIVSGKKYGKKQKTVKKEDDFYDFLRYYGKIQQIQINIALNVVFLFHSCMVLTFSKYICIYIYICLNLKCI